MHDDDIYAGKQKLKYAHTIMQTLKFDEEDLEANRQGLLGQNQRTPLLSAKMTWIVYLVCAFVICSIASFHAVWDGIRYKDSASSRIAIFCLLVIVASSVIIYIYLILSRYKLDLKYGRVKSVTGRVRLDVDFSRQSGNVYFVSVDNKAFKVNKPIFLAFKNGDPYIVYFTPYSKTIVAAEWLH